MKASKFADDRKAFVLKQGMDEVPLGDICRRAGINDATYCNWKKEMTTVKQPSPFNHSHLRTNTPSQGSEHRNES